MVLAFIVIRGRGIWQNRPANGNVTRNKCYCWHACVREIKKCRENSRYGIVRIISGCRGRYESSN